MAFSSFEKLTVIDASSEDPEVEALALNVQKAKSLTISGRSTPESGLSPAPNSSRCAFLPVAMYAHSVRSSTAFSTCDNASSVSPAVQLRLLLTKGSSSAGFLPSFHKNSIFPPLLSLAALAVNASVS